MTRKQELINYYAEMVPGFFEEVYEKMAEERLAEVARWQQVAEKASAEREHNANVADELRADKERLDWLQAQEVKHARDTETYYEDFDFLVLAEDGTTCWGKSYREAIDIARTAEQPKEDSQ